MMDFAKTKLFPAVLSAALCACFLAQVMDQVDKFLRRDSTMVVKFEDDAGLVFPTLTICPEEGFDKERMAGMNLSEDE